MASVTRHRGRGVTAMPGSVRMRRLREWRRGGCLFVTQVEIREADVAALVRTGRLAPDRRADRAAVLDAIERLLDDFVREGPGVMRHG